MGPTVAPNTADRSSRAGICLRLLLGVLVFVAVALLLAAPAHVATLSFPDVPPAHPYREAISDLASRGIIAGYENGDFGPDDPVTRQQFAKMIVLTGGYPVTEADTSPFFDVEESPPGSLFPDHYVAVAAARGITKGTSPGYFSPGVTISRFQVVSMVVRAMDDLFPDFLSTPPPAWAQTPRWSGDGTHGPNARRAEYHGLLDGLPLAALDPWGAMPRAEVAQILHNLLRLERATSQTTSRTDVTYDHQRAAIYSAMGSAWGGSEVYVRVWLRTSGDWTYARVIPYTTGYGPTLDVRALLRRSQGHWQVLELYVDRGLQGDIGAAMTDWVVPETLKAAYPEAPADIFPPRDPEVEAMMDAVRAALEQPDWVFNVFTLSRVDDWGYSELRAFGYLGGHAVERTEYRVLLQKTGGAWNVLETADHATVTQEQFVAQIKALHPDVPPGLLPEPPAP